MGEHAFLGNLPRHVFFTGKGGVGKTSIACATAVALADAEKRVLLVSTDPASNVAQVLGQTIGNQVTPIAEVPGLSAMEIDPEAAAEAYREKIIGPVRGLLPETELASVAEQLSGSCTTEIASFNEFTDLLANEQLAEEYDHVIFDTAPTGHTIRLLQLPGEWTTFLDEGKGDASCLGPMSGLDKTRSQYAIALARLCDPTMTRMVLVARAQASALEEAARTARELAELGITEQHLVVNGVLGDADDDVLARAIAEREQRALAALPDPLGSLPVSYLPLRPRSVVGLESVRQLLVEVEASTSTGATVDPGDSSDLHPLDDLVDDLARQNHGLIMCMGKGGVGKTTTAVALALALAKRGKRVHLSTTDPAAHLDTVLAGAQHDHLTVSRVDPEEATRAYRERVLATKGAKLDEVGRAQLDEDLRSPCTEEVAVFGQFSHLVARSRKEIVVIDTAPTGHTLMLMDATGSYHREIVRGMGEGVNLITPLMRLQDPDQTRVIIVTLPEATPVQEAVDLAADLERAGITPWAWVINQSIAVAGTGHPLLAARAVSERDHIERVRAQTERVAMIAMLVDEPTGAAMEQLTGHPGATAAAG